MNGIRLLITIVGLFLGLTGSVLAQTTIPSNPIEAVDFSGDGIVDFADFLTFASQFNKKTGDPTFNSRIDIDQDGIVGFSDFLRFAAQFNKTWTPSSGTGSTPTSVLATAQSGTAIQVTWNAVTGATGYKIERRVQGISTYTSVAENQTGTTFSDSNLIPGTEYTYRVSSISSSGTSNPSSTITAQTTASGNPSGSPVVISGNITANRTLTADKSYLLKGAVFVQSGATLTIEPGTQIFGEGVSRGTLIVAQGGKIIANGTKDKPIVFTSDQEVGQRDRGQWGGLIINGRAPINTGATALGEGDTGQYGGTVSNDDSGILRYVRVEFAGIEFSPDNELNGIAFQGVGSGTTVEYVQVHFNQDDGIEFFGGTVNAKHLYCTGIRDDNFDWTDGWSGKGQFWVAQQRGDDADNGFEADNDADNNEALPRSNPTIYNVTLIGDPNGPESVTGLRLREGTAGTLRNLIVMGFNTSGLDIDTPSTITQANSGGLSVQNSIFFNSKISGQPGNFSNDSDNFDEAAWAKTTSFNNSESDPVLAAPYSLKAPDFRPMAGSPAINGAVPVATPPSDGFFETVNFIGGVDPNNNWLAGWITTEQPKSN